jgi:YesN/AraC family two-component response regulator
VLEASNGLEAMNVFNDNSNKVSLIITDIVMPKLSGFEAVDRIRKSHPDIKVIFSTGYDKAESLPEELILDGMNTLSKPYKISEIAAAIRYQLDS